MAEFASNNPDVTEEGHNFLVHALDHEFASDEPARQESLEVALGLGHTEE